MKTRKSAPTLHLKSLAIATNLRIQLGFIVAFIVLGVAIPLTISSSVRTLDIEGPEWWLLVIVIWSAARLSQLIAKAKVRPLVFSFHTFVYVWLGLAPLAQYDANYLPLLTPLLGIRPRNSGYDDLVPLVILAGIVAFELGHSWKTEAPLKWRGELRRIRLELLCLTAIPLAGIAVMLRGGLITLFSARQISRELAGATEGAESLVGYGLARAALGFPLLVAVLGLIVWRRSGRSPGHRGIVSSPAWMVALVLALAVVSLPISSTRVWTGTVVLAIGFALATTGSRARRRLTMVLALAAVLLVFPYADLFRRDLSTSLEITSARNQLATNSSYSMYAQIAMGVSYVDRSGFSFGQQSIGSLFFFVPRSLWSGKPIDTGDLVALAEGLPSRLNPSSPLWEEGFVEGGWGGVVILFFLLGFVSARLERHGDNDLRYARKGRASLLVPLLGGYLIFILRGSLLAATPTLAGLLVIVWAITARRRRSVLHHHDQIGATNQPSFDTRLHARVDRES
ncbi:MAG: hypothetical protein WD646_13415 [Actinomycetota bacterium]